MLTFKSLQLRKSLTVVLFLLISACGQGTAVLGAKSPNTNTKSNVKTGYLNVCPTSFMGCAHTISYISKPYYPGSQTSVTMWNQTLTSLLASNPNGGSYAIQFIGTVSQEYDVYTGGAPDPSVLTDVIHVQTIQIIGGPY